MMTGRFSWNVSKLFSQLKLVTDNLFSIYAAADWKTTERWLQSLFPPLNKVWQYGTSNVAKEMYNSTSHNVKGIVLSKCVNQKAVFGAWRLQDVDKDILHVYCNSYVSTATSLIWHLWPHLRSRLSPPPKMQEKWSMQYTQARRTNSSKNLTTFC